MTSASQANKSHASLRSPVYWSLLGLIIERPDYGNGLAQRYEREFGEALPISSPSGVYEGLNALQRVGLVEEYIAKGGRRRQPTPFYRATPDAALAYRDWLMTHLPIERLGPRCFARQLAALAAEPQLGLEVIARYEHACLEEARTGQMLDSASSSVGTASPAVALPAEQARLAAMAELPWARYARALFTKLASTRSPDGPT